MPSRWKNYALLVATIVVTWLLLEAGYYVMEGFEPDPTNFTQGYFNKPSAYFDVDNGFLWRTGDTRTTRIIHGEVVIDQVFTANDRGYVSKHDYPYQRPPNTKRVVVFGDSFTSGIFLAHNWVDRVHAALGETGLSFDAFAMDGGGMLNWHHTFFHEVVPKYEFDAIVIAVFAGDLGRAFNISWGEGRDVKTTYVNAPPPSQEAFDQTVRPHGRTVAFVRTDEEIDTLIAEHRTGGWRAPKFRFYAATDIYRRIRYLWAGATLIETWHYEKFGAPSEPLTRADFFERYPNVAPQMFEVLDHAKKNDIPVLWASIPSRGSAANFSILDGYQQNEHQRELRSLAALYGHAYFDGYEAFRGLSPDEIDQTMYLKYDAHWSQKGSDRFAEKLAAFLRGWEPLTTRP